MMRMLIVPLASLGVLVATDGTALAGKSDHGFIGQTGRVEPHARYQNDVAYEFGTVSKRGPRATSYPSWCRPATSALVRPRTRRAIAVRPSGPW